MNILLIYPEFPDTFWSFKHALQFIRKKASLPPLGLLTVAAMLPENWNQRLIDLNLCRLKPKDLDWADLVFISAMAIQRGPAQRVIQQCKTAGVAVVAGGPLFTSEPDAFPEVDQLVLGEAEGSLPPFLQDLSESKARRLYHCDGFPDIAESPLPLWKLADLKGYASLALQYSRGCPFDCEFCNITALFGHRPRIKSAEQVTRELDVIYNLGWRSPVFFVDDNFIGNKRHLKEELLPALIEWRKDKTGMPFNTEASINLADDEPLMELMVSAGFNTVFIGVETPAAESLNECNKTQNLGRDLIGDVKRLQRAGLQVQGGFIIGFDSDTPSIFQRQIEFIQESGIVTAMVGLLQAPLGTRLHDRMARDNRISGTFSGDNVDGRTNIVPLMDPEILQKGYKKVIETLYTPANYFQRVRTFLKEYQLPDIREVLDRQQILAFFRSIVRLGVIDQARWEYWKLFFWTIFHRPRLFPLAIMFSIYGYHFRQVNALHIQ